MIYCASAGINTLHIKIIQCLIIHRNIESYFCSFFYTSILCQKFFLIACLRYSLTEIKTTCMARYIEERAGMITLN